MIQFLHLVFLLLFCHALADYPLQGHYLAASKRSYRPEGANGFWIVGLSTHALIHAGFVLLVTRSLILGGCEFCAHWLIDLAKCHGKIDRLEDQALHVFCKVAWALLLLGGIA